MKCGSRRCKIGGRWMRDVATVHVLGQLPKYQLARMVLNHSDVSVRCSDLTHGENRSWCEYILVIYIAVHLIIRCRLKSWFSPNWLYRRGSSMQIHHPGSSSPMSDEVVLSRGHLDCDLLPSGGTLWGAWLGRSLRCPPILWSGGSLMLVLQ